MVVREAFDPFNSLLRDQRDSSWWLKLELRTFNSLLRDQWRVVGLWMLWLISSFNSLLRDQIGLPIALGVDKLSFQFSLARSDVKPELSTFEALISILSCEISGYITSWLQLPVKQFQFSLARSALHPYPFSHSFSLLISILSCEISRSIVNVKPQTFAISILSCEISRLTVVKPSSDVSSYFNSLLRDQLTMLRGLLSVVCVNFNSLLRDQDYAFEDCWGPAFYDFNSLLRDQKTWREGLKMHVNNKFQFSLARSEPSQHHTSCRSTHISILSCEISAPVLSDFRLFNPFCGDLIAGKQFF